MNSVTVRWRRPILRWRKGLKVRPLAVGPWCKWLEGLDSKRCRFEPGRPHNRRALHDVVDECIRMLNYEQLLLLSFIKF